MAGKTPANTKTIDHEAPADDPNAFPGDQALTTTGNGTGTALAVATDFEQDGGDRFDMSDVSIPFIVILQALSPQCDKQNPAYIEGASPGMILNTATGEIYDGEKGVNIVVVTHQRRYTEWWPRNSKKGKGLVTDFGGDRGAALGRVLDQNSYPWMTADETTIIEAGTYYIMAVNDDGAVARGVLNLQGTQLKKYKTLNTMMSSWQLRGVRGFFNPPMFARMYRMRSVPERNDQGNWYGFKFTPGPALGPTGDAALDAQVPEYGPAIYAMAKGFKEQISAGDVRVAEPMTETEAAAGEEDAPF